MAVKSSNMSAVEGQRCAICRKPAVPQSRPFCSKRCADIDLARWLGGGYVIAGSNAVADEDATGTAPGSIPVSRDDDDEPSSAQKP